MRILTYQSQDPSSSCIYYNIINQTTTRCERTAAHTHKDQTAESLMIRVSLQVIPGFFVLAFLFFYIIMEFRDILRILKHWNWISLLLYPTTTPKNSNVNSENWSESVREREREKERVQSQRRIIYIFD